MTPIDISGFVYFLIFVALSIIILKIIRKSRSEEKTAMSEYYNILGAYDLMMKSRREYHNSKFLDNPEREAKQEFWKEENEKAIKVLEKPLEDKYKKHLSSYQIALVEEVQARPRYGIF